MRLCSGQKTWYPLIPHYLKHRHPVYFVDHETSFYLYFLTCPSFSFLIHLLAAFQRMTSLTPRCSPCQNPQILHKVPNVKKINPDSASFRAPKKHFRPPRLGKPTRTHNGQMNWPVLVLMPFPHQLCPDSGWRLGWWARGSVPGTIESQGHA